MSLCSIHIPEVHHYVLCGDHSLSLGLGFIGEASIIGT